LRVGYYINKQFILDDGTPAGVNVMFFSGSNLDYWDGEIRYTDLKEALEAIESVKRLPEVELVEVIVKDCPNELKPVE